MKQWFNGLQQREQQLVVAMALVVLVGILYWGLWQPLSERLERARAGVQAQQRLLAWVEKNADEVIRLRAKGGQNRTVSRGSLNQIANQTAGRFQLVLTRLQPQGERLQIWIDKAEFTQLLKWLGMLQRDHGIRIDSVDLAADDQRGFVNVRRLVLAK